MTIPSPLQNTLEEYQVEYTPQHDGEHREGASTGSFQAQLLSEFIPWGEDGCSVLATTGIVELEYAAIQKSAAIFDASNRSTIKITGSERLDFVSRLTTQQLLDMKKGESKLAFVTSRKGAVLADVVIHVLEDFILLDVDCTVANQLIEHIKAYIVMEDVHVEDVTDQTHWFWMLGPSSTEYTTRDAPWYKLPKEFLGIDCIAIAIQPENAIVFWEGAVQNGARPVGWYALNMARVEQGTPMFMIDFDMNNLPHETSLIQSRVRFDKGCYLGQEIVARMESLGQPKKRLVELEMEIAELPVSGTQLWEDETGIGTQVGVVTSSAISPLRGGVPTVLAMVAKKSALPGNRVYMYIGQEIYQAEIKDL